LSGTDYLNFTGTTFDATTRDGSLHYLRLGSFYWDAFQGSSIVDSPFTLFISFTNPTGVSPDPIYNGDIEGLVIRGKINGVRYGESTVQAVFEPNVRTYEFTGGDPDLAGSFTLTLNDTYVPASGGHVVGQITGATTVTPEPISMVLMGSGLAGLAAARRRKRRQQSA
jgi:hypothetical protein